MSLHVLATERGTYKRFTFWLNVTEPGGIENGTTARLKGVIGVDVIMTVNDSPTLMVGFWTHVFARLT